MSAREEMTGTRKSGSGDEIDAMRQVADALEGLERDAAHRVLKWAAERFALVQPMPVSSADGGKAGVLATFADVADLFSRTRPRTEAQKALVVGYWFQVAQGLPDFDSQAVNSELKHLGHPVANITRALTYLMESTPSFVMQIRKAGTTRQARKQYRLTSAGIRAVEETLSAKSEN